MYSELTTRTHLGTQQDAAKADGHLLRCAQGGIHTPEIGKLGLCQGPPQGGKLAPELLEMDRGSILQFFTFAKVVPAVQEVDPCKCVPRRAWIACGGCFAFGIGPLSAASLSPMTSSALEVESIRPEG